MMHGQQGDHQYSLALCSSIVDAVKFIVFVCPQLSCDTCLKWINLRLSFPGPQKLLQRFVWVLACLRGQILTYTCPDLACFRQPMPYVCPDLACLRGQDQ